MMNLQNFPGDTPDPQLKRATLPRGALRRAQGLRPLLCPIAPQLQILTTPLKVIGDYISKSKFRPIKCTLDMDTPSCRSWSLQCIHHASTQSKISIFSYPPFCPLYIHNKTKLYYQKPNFCIFFFLAVDSVGCFFTVFALSLLLCIFFDVGLCRPTSSLAAILLLFFSNLTTFGLGLFLLF